MNHLISRARPRTSLIAAVVTLASVYAFASSAPAASEPVAAHSVIPVVPVAKRAPAAERVNPQRRQTLTRAQRSRRAAAARSRRRRARHRRTGYIWPVRGVVTSRFGRRPRFGFHHGLDIACRAGSPVRASKPGRVVWAGRAKFYGRTVVIQHRRGYSTLYAHMRGFLSYGGQRVRRGQAIGLCGSSGRSTGPHVHFEIRRKGVHYNPLPYLRRGRSSRRHGER